MNTPLPPLPNVPQIINFPCLMKHLIMQGYHFSLRFDGELVRANLTFGAALTYEGSGATPESAIASLEVSLEHLEMDL